MVGVKPGVNTEPTGPGGSLLECEQRGRAGAGAPPAPGCGGRYPSCRRRRHRSGVSWVQGSIPLHRETIHVCARGPLGSKEESGLVQLAGTPLPAGEGEPLAGPWRLHTGLEGVPGPRGSVDSHPIGPLPHRQQIWRRRRLGGRGGRRHHRRKCTRLTEQGGELHQGNRGPRFSWHNLTGLRGWRVGDHLSLAPPRLSDWPSPTGQCGCLHNGAPALLWKLSVKAPVPTMHATKDVEDGGTWPD